MYPSQMKSNMLTKITGLGICLSLQAFNAYGEIMILSQDSPQYQECKNLISNPLSQIDILAETPSIDHSLSAREIAELRKRLVGISDTKNHGMTYAKLRHQYHIDGKARKLANGKTCVQISLIGELKFEKFIIYVEKKFPESSCAYKEIMKHEQLHVAHYKADLEKVKNEALNQFDAKYRGKILVYDRDPKLEAIAKDLGDYTSSRFNEISNQSALKVDSSSTWKHIINRCLRES